MGNAFWQDDDEAQCGTDGGVTRCWIFGQAMANLLTRRVKPLHVYVEKLHYNRVLNLLI